MKNYLILTVLSLFILNCGNSQKADKEIQTVQDDWQAITAQLNDFVEHINETTDNWMDMYEGMSIEADKEEQLTAEALTKMEELKNTCLGHGEIYKTIKVEVMENQTQLKSQSGLLNQLENKPSDKERKENLKQLRQTISAAQKKLKSWEAEVEKNKTECLKICQEYAALVKEIG